MEKSPPRSYNKKKQKTNIQKEMLEKKKEKK